MYFLQNVKIYFVEAEAQTFSKIVNFSILKKNWHWKNMTLGKVEKNMN